MIVAYPKTQEIQFSSFFSLFLFQTTKPRSDLLRGFVVLPGLFRVFKLKIKNADRIAVLNAHLFQTLKQA